MSCSMHLSLWKMEKQKSEKILRVCILDLGYCRFKLKTVGERFKECADTKFDGDMFR